MTISVVSVFYMNGKNKCKMGRLARKDRKIFFEYDPEFLKTGFELSPFQLPLRPGIILCEDRLFDGLFGVFNDSLPDGWGRLLLDRKLASHGLNSAQLSPLDRLCYVGHHGMGALAYEPEMEEAEAVVHQDLDLIAQEAIAFLDKQDDRFVEDLLVMNGSSAGARPKILVSFSDNSFKAGDHWLIKFPSSLDPKDNGPIEYAYHLMAKAAGLEVPEARLFSSKQGPGYFGVRRFDRTKEGRIHMHTLSGLLHVDHRVPSFDYEYLMKVTWKLTQDLRECKNQFRAAVFNLLVHNRDDHAKNFSFLMDEKGFWRLSPAYDLTYSFGPSGEHCTLYMGEGKSPTLSHLLALGKVAELDEHVSRDIINQISEVVSRWKDFAREGGVSSKSTSLIQQAMNRTRV
jgi:serine/threonine-protein kinase HipA